MTLPRLALLLPLFALLLLAFACKDGGGSTNQTPSPSPTSAETAQPNGDASPAPSPNGTPPPNDDVTPPPVEGATPVTLQTDVSAFRTQFDEVIDTTPPCGYDPDTAVVDCSEWDGGVYQLDDPLTGEGVECRAMLVSVGFVGVNCQTRVEPLLIADYALPDYDLN
jgi:hypothetical protein